MEPVFWILPGVAVPIEIYREASNSARQNSAEENIPPAEAQSVAETVRAVDAHARMEAKTPPVDVCELEGRVHGGAVWTRFKRHVPTEQRVNEAHA